MQEFIDRLKEISIEHNIEMPDDPLELDPYACGADRYEVSQLQQALYEEYYDACCFDECE